MAWTNPTQPNVTDYTNFLRSSVNIQSGVLPDGSESIALSLSVAVATVNRALQIAGTGANVNGLLTLSVYVQACYHLATDRLFNWATDVPGQTFFEDKRAEMGLMKPAIGVSTSASDQGTAGSLMNPEQLKQLTLDDLQTLKTFWGRAYLGMAQAFGPTLFGLG